MPLSFGPSTLMEKYDMGSFLQALETHSRKTREPVNLTTYSGSQIKCGLKRLTRSQVAAGGPVDSPDNDEQAAHILEDMVLAARKSMRHCTFYVAHANSQHINGISESNSKQAKHILRSLVGSVQKAGITYDSFIKLISTFERVADLLNSRPIFFDSNSTISVKNLMFPSCSIRQ